MLRQDKTGRAVLTILRQLKRLHEVRLLACRPDHALL